MSFYSYEELKRIGFSSFGENVLISKKASIYGAKNIDIGNNVRIDDFCVLSCGNGKFKIGNYIHIAVYSSIIGAGDFILSDFSNISSRVSIYTSNDDYSGNFMTNPMVPDTFTNVKSLSVFIGKHVIIGSGTIVLPGIHIEDGCAIGALSLVNNNCERNNIYAGVPVKKIKKRKTNYISLEKKLLSINND